jgi:hypothetical protein
MGWGVPARRGPSTAGFGGESMASGGVTIRTKPLKVVAKEQSRMSATVTDRGPGAGLSEKQQRILAYLQANVDEQTYFKSRCIGEALDLSAKEVGTNMQAIQSVSVDLDVEKWGYSSSTTWMVTA